jgi:hypothetical protein
MVRFLGLVVQRGVHLVGIRRLKSELGGKSHVCPICSYIPFD